MALITLTPDKQRPKKIPQKVSGKPLVGSRSPGIGFLYLLFILISVLAFAYLLSGGPKPVDPNSAGGPPTIEPYFDPNDYGKQKILITPGSLDNTEEGLQLKTFIVNTCGQKTAVDFLIDVSGSMQFDNKLAKTKEALRIFTDNLVGKSVIGIQTFSKEAKEVVPLRYYKDVREDVDKAIDDMQPGGHTVTRDAFNLAKAKLSAAITTNKYPDYHYALIVMTDGVPEIPPDQPRTCHGRVADDPNTAPAQRCFAQEQDPRVPTDLARDIKNLGVDIYAVNIFSPNYPSDVVMHPHLEKLLKDVVSQPIETHYYDSINADNLQAIFDQVINNICEIDVPAERPGNYNPNYWTPAPNAPTSAGVSQ